MAPGTWGSIVGVLIYLGYAEFLRHVKHLLIDRDWSFQQYNSLFWVLTAVLLIAFCLISFWASRKTEEIHGKKDSQKIVVDEIVGQFVVFAFVPFEISRWLILAGFLLFRLFDIWKPYPTRMAEELPNGIGVVADDIVAGVYAGVCLSAIYFVSVIY